MLFACFFQSANYLLRKNYVNNLDLNGDENTDYISVIGKTNGEASAIILQLAINSIKSQDVAVIEIEKQGNESAF